MSVISGAYLILVIGVFGAFAIVTALVTAIERREAHRTGTHEQIRC